jgi:tRNA(fMet)-specific endonuclease VapC
MARRLILDTGVLIASERGSRDVRHAVAPEDDVVIAAVTVAELRAGVELASDDHGHARSQFVARVLKALPVVPYDLATADAHARLLAHVHRTGGRRGAHDLLIAATALVTNRTLVSTDRSGRFSRLPGVQSILLE